MLEEIKDTGDKVLFIMDDVVNDMKKEHQLEKLLCKVLMNRRHICGSAKPRGPNKNMKRLTSVRQTKPTASG